MAAVNLEHEAALLRIREAIPRQDDYNAFMNGVNNMVLSHNPAVGKKELEVRFGIYYGGGDFIPNNPVKVFYELVDQFSRATNLYTKVTRVSTGRGNVDVGFPIKSEVQSFRGDVRSEEFFDARGESVHLAVSRKRREGVLDNRAFGFRVALSTETDLPLSDLPSAETLTLVRQKTRWSFVAVNTTSVPSHPFAPFRIDLTKVVSAQGGGGKNTTSYEVELELVEPLRLSGRDPTRGFLFAVMKFCATIQKSAGVQFVLSKNEQKRVIRAYNSMYSDVIHAAEPRWEWTTYSNFNKPINLPRELLILDPAQANRLSVTAKASGERCFVILLPEQSRPDRVALPTDGLGVYLVRPITTLITKVGLVQNAINARGNTLIDCEFVEGKKAGQMYILAFDILFVNGVDYRRQPLSQRLRGLDGVIRDIPKLANVISMKQFVIGQPNKTLFERVREMFQSLERSPPDYELDGLIFNRIDGDYNSTVYKWKPAEQMTIDFVLKQRAGDGNRTIYDLEVLSDDRSGALVPFRGQSITVPDRLANTIESGQVAECIYDRQTRQFKIERMRLDRVKPNGLGVAKAVWGDIMRPITRAMITGAEPIPPPPVKTRPGTLVSKLQSLVKRDLINVMFDGVRTVLDIGGSPFVRDSSAAEIAKFCRLSKSVLSIETRDDNAAVFRQKADSFFVTRNGNNGTDRWRDSTSAVQLLKVAAPINGNDISHRAVPLFLTAVAGGGPGGGDIDVEPTAAAPTSMGGMTLFHSLGQFFQSEESLDRLIGLVDANLNRDGGIFVALAIDGNALVRHMRENFVTAVTYWESGGGGGGVNSQHHYHERYRISLMDTSKWSQTFDRIVRLEFAPDAKPRVDYLVDFDELSDRLAAIGVETVASHSLSVYAAELRDSGFTQSDKFLNDICRVFIGRRTPVVESGPRKRRRVVELGGEDATEGSGGATVVFDESNVRFHAFQPPANSVTIKNMVWSRDTENRSGSLLRVLESAFGAPEVYFSRIEGAIRGDGSGSGGGVERVDSVLASIVQSMKTRYTSEQIATMLEDPMQWDLLGLVALLPGMFGRNVVLVSLDPSVHGSRPKIVQHQFSPEAKTVVVLVDQGDYELLYLTDAGGGRKIEFGSDDSIVADLLK